VNEPVNSPVKYGPGTLDPSAAEWRRRRQPKLSAAAAEIFTAHRGAVMATCIGLVVKLVNFNAL